MKLIGNEPKPPCPKIPQESPPTEPDTYKFDYDMTGEPADCDDSGDYTKKNLHLSFHFSENSTGSYTCMLEQNEDGMIEEGYDQYMEDEQPYPADEHHEIGDAWAEQPYDWYEPATHYEPPVGPAPPPNGDQHDLQQPPPPGQYSTFPIDPAQAYHGACSTPVYPDHSEWPSLSYAHNCQMELYNQL